MKKHKSKMTNKKCQFHHLKSICWIIVPVITVVLLVLDALGIYIFNMQRLIVLGISLLVILLPFFREITIKGISIKCSKTESNTDDEMQTTD